MDQNKLSKLKEAMHQDLVSNILPFWMEKAMDKENGGFYGAITNKNTVYNKTKKGGILNSRILWTYALAYRTFGDQKYLDTAKHAYDFLVNHIWDKEYGGLYWMVDYKGNPTNTRKQFYNIAFGIYALSEYYRASNEQESLQKAIELYNLVEKYSYDPVHKGYIEASTREWESIEDQRLSEKDANAKKSMNTHLHILEAYTHLYRVWKDEAFRIKFKELIRTTIDQIVDGQKHCFKLFFNEDFSTLGDEVSYGHDIEGSWLIFEAAEVLGDEALIEETKQLAVHMAQKVYEKGVDWEYGGVYYDTEHGEMVDKNKSWWPQAEGVVGFLNAYELASDEKYLDAAIHIWEFTEKHIIDKEHGEWFSKVTREGKPFTEELKVQPWKCPYHNSRACFEALVRVDRMLG